MTEPPPPPQQPPPPSEPPPSSGGPPPGWTPPSAGAPGYAALPQTDGTAIAALCVAIGQFVLGGLLCGLPVGAIVAIVLARNSQQKINESGGRLSGDGLNTAAKIIGWIYIGLFVVGVVVVIIILAAGGF